jgi:hypothetical protein
MRANPSPTPPPRHAIRVLFTTRGLDLRVRKIECIVRFARCKGWRAKVVTFFACQNATVLHFRSAALGLAALRCATCRPQPCSLQPYSLQPATLPPAASQFAALQPCSLLQILVTSGPGPPGTPKSARWGQKGRPRTPQNRHTFLTHRCFWNPGWGTSPGTVPTGLARKIMQKASTVSPGNQFYGRFVTIVWAGPLSAAESSVPDDGIL